METLFRLLLSRPAIQQAEDARSIQLTQNSNYQATLATALGSNDPRGVMKNASRQFVATAGFAAKPGGVPLYAELRKLADALALLENDPALTPAKVAKAVKDTFGAQAGTVIGKPAFVNAAAMLRDSLIAIKQLPEEHGRPIEELTQLLRDLEVVEKVAADAQFPTDGAALRRYRKRSVQLPTQADLRSILDARDKAKQDAEERARKEAEQRKELLDRIDLFGRLKKAVEEVMGLDKSHLEVTAQAPDGGSMPAADVRPMTVFAADIARKHALGQLAVLAAQKDVRKDTVQDVKGAAMLAGISNGGSDSKAAHGFFAGTGAFQPLTALQSMFRFKAGTDDLLSDSTRKLLKERGLGLAVTAIDTIVLRLREEMDALSKELDGLTGSSTLRSMKRMGGTMIITSTPRPSAWSTMMSKGTVAFAPALIGGSVPTSKGTATPVGVADLLVVKQHLTGYEGADVAHIENVLKGERKERDHRRLQQTETITFTESESTRTDEQELESTDRFEMTRESSSVIKEDASLKAGLSISGSYGPTVEFSASAEGSLSRSKEEATKTASKFSKDVTQRSTKKITERLLQRDQRRVLIEIEEKNNHLLDNVGGAKNIAGVYQWVEKTYEAQMFNYGMRMMYDFMVPEPGAFLMDAMQQAHQHALLVEKPMAFCLRPDQLNEWNYHFWVHQYGAGGVQPPPEEFVTKSYDYHANGGDDKTNYVQSGIIQLDEGYKAVHGTVGKIMNIWDSSAFTDVILGRRSHRFHPGDWMFNTGLDDEQGSIPFGLKTLHVSDLSLIVEVKCQRTERAMTKWQLETHAKLMDAYMGKVADYEEKLAAAQMQAGVAIQGKNPGLNLELMQDELKKNCISIITAQHYDLFDAIQPGSTGLAQIDLVEADAEGPYVRFFEQAFEWEHMTWVTYPYFWGRKQLWDERIALEDTDPLFNQFMKAGYCRVVVPVRPGFEGAVDHFTTFGEIWNGGPLPAISNPLYLPIADELAERLDRPGDEIPQGDPWEVRVPTDLVYLRGDDKLPSWKKDAAGNWVPA